MQSLMECRPGCGACCIAPSITSALPGMPLGKAAGERCIHLSQDFRCELFGLPERPTFCVGLQPHTEMCADSREEALTYLYELEILTQPRTSAAQQLTVLQRVLKAPGPIGEEQ